jgi:hypothetical protein
MSRAATFLALLLCVGCGDSSEPAAQTVDDAADASTEGGSDIGADVTADTATPTDARVDSAAIDSTVNDATVTDATAPDSAADSTMTDGGPPVDGGAKGFALRFFGVNTGTQVDRVRIPLDPNVPANVGAGDFTVEGWVKSTTPGTTACSPGKDNWIYGRIVIDQDVNGAGDFGDYGVSIFSGGVVAFGVAVGSTGNGLCGKTSVTDGAWHHVACTRNAATGQLRIFVDGKLDAEGSGPTGNASYRAGRTGGSEADRFLTFGGEKHAFEGYPWYAGLLDEVRLSTTIRYSAPFTRPSAPFAEDASTAALWHFDEGSGTTLGDSSGAAGGPSNGTLLVGGPSSGPKWVADSPF